MRKERTEREGYDLCALSLELTAKELGYDLAVIMSKRRDIEAVRQRRNVAVALRDKGYSLPAIGYAMQRHHSSILSLVNPVFRLRKQRQFRERYKEIHAK